MPKYAGFEYAKMFICDTVYVNPNFEKELHNASYEVVIRLSTSMFLYQNTAVDLLNAIH